VITHRRPRRGYTIIEVLAVLVVIGLIAAIAILRWQDSRGRATDMVLRSDLHNLLTAQEAHFHTTGAYGTDLARMGFRGSPGVTVTVTAADASGWAATATHPRTRVASCAIFAGRVAAPPPPATTEGVIACE
jgi:prepilin-type N-terminal cleavage/methylation domain-containing protein